MGAPDDMITFNAVDKRYRIRGGYKVILENADIHLPNRNIAVLGANGTGKSTLLRMISGAEKPDSGVIECDRRVSFPLGFAGSFNGTLSGIENALFTSRIYGEDTEAVIEYVKEFSQLGEQLYMPFKTYSSGMRARLAFGVSLAIDFEIYLVDEITAVGDARFRERSKEAFKSKLDTASIVMVSHSVGTLRDYCDAGVVLDEGRMYYYDDLEEAIRHHNKNMGQPMPKKPAGPGGAGKGGAGQRPAPKAPAKKAHGAGQQAPASALGNTGQPDAPARQENGGTANSGPPPIPGPSNPRAGG